MHYTVEVIVDIIICAKAILSQTQITNGPHIFTSKVSGQTHFFTHFNTKFKTNKIKIKIQ